MRLLLAFAATSLAFVVGGCDSVDSRLRERFEAPQPKTHVFEAEPQVVFDAAVVAMKRIDFRVTRAAAAQGIIKGISALDSGGPGGDARQFTIEVKIEESDSGRTDVSVLLREQRESSAFAGATDLPLREHGLYDSYFAALEQALKEKLTAPAKAP